MRSAPENTGRRVRAQRLARLHPALAVLAVAILGCPANQTDIRPNIVLVVVDTLRADRVGAYGSAKDLTPELDRLAAASVVFERSVSTSTWTLPTTATLMTGLLPNQHGLTGIMKRLAPDQLTVAEQLRRAGYATAAITDGGFTGPSWGFGRGFDHFAMTPGPAWGPKDVRVVVDAALGWLRRNEREPYFLWVHTYEIHQPYRNPEGFADELLPAGCADRFPAGVEVKWERPPRPRDQPCVEAFYDGGVRRADHHLGRLLAELRRSPSWSRTFVVVTSDHGEEFGEHGDWEHGLGKVFDPNVAVPLIVRDPRDTRGHRVTVPVSTLDITPTLLDIAGISGPETLPGRSVLDLVNSTRVERPIAVHGFNSHPDLNEEKWRLDLGDETLVYDRVRSQLRTYVRGQDHGDQGSPRVDPADPALRWLQLLVADGAEGGWAIALPGDTKSVSLPEAGDWRVLGHLRGTRWIPAARPETSWAIADANSPLLLVLAGPADFRDGPVLSVEDASGVVRTSKPSRVRRSQRWRRLDGPAPAEGELFQLDARGPAPTRTLTESQAAELGALGYVE